MRPPSYLLDTQIIIWLDGDPKRVSTAVREMLALGSSLYFSAASAWETAIKRAGSKLNLAAPLTVIAAQLKLVEVQVTAMHGEAAGALPRHHGDPFDRLIVAQAQLEGLILVTSDALLKRYDVELLLV